MGNTPTKSLLKITLFVAVIGKRVISRFYTTRVRLFVDIAEFVFHLWQHSAKRIAPQV